MSDRQKIEDTHLLSHWMSEICPLVPEGQTVLSLVAVGRVVIVVTDYFVYQAKPLPHWTGSEWVTSFTIQMMGHIER